MGTSSAIWWIAVAFSSHVALLDSQEVTYFLDSHFLKLRELGRAHVWMQSALGLLLLALGRRALNDWHERLAEHFLFTWPRRRG
jgi:hypothetical protein